MAGTKKSVASLAKKSAGGESLMTVGLSLPPETVEEIDAFAKKALRTRASEMRLMIEFALRHKKAGGSFD